MIAVVVFEGVWATEKTTVMPKITLFIYRLSFIFLPQNALK